RDGGSARRSRRGVPAGERSRGRARGSAAGARARSELGRREAAPRPPRRPLIAFASPRPLLPLRSRPHLLYLIPVDVKILIVGASDRRRRLSRDPTERQAVGV